MNKFKFEVYFYGDTQKISPVLSKARVRIFYKGLNRNFTFITDEFADKLLSTLPYTPVIGKFEDGDFSNHGNGEQLQVYGIVPETPNLTWEDHFDKDGVTRSYACCDVLLFTARFPEAKSIVGGTAQSMELYDKSVKGDWVYQDGKKFFRFEDACFIGLCALGENTEPCFEGAAFYEYAESLKAITEELKKYNMNGGNKTMDFKFKLSDSQKFEAIWRLVNPNIEEGYFESAVCEVYDDYALCYNYEENKYFRAYYTKNDEDDSVVINEKVDAYVLDVTQSEYEILKRLESVNGSFSAIEEKLNAEPQNFELKEGEGETEPAEGGEKADDDAPAEPVKGEEEGDEGEPEGEPEVEPEAEPVEEPEGEPIEEPEGEPAGEPENEFSLKISQYESQILELQDKISTYELENKNLLEYKNNAENQKKLNLLSKYSARLPEDVLNEFKSRISEFEFDDFKKEVSAKVLEINEDSLFNGKQNDILPNGNFEVKPQPQNGAERLLSDFLEKKER